jgi:predicted acyl esterase
VFQTGSNHWEKYDSWPPRIARDKRLYLRAGGKLSWDAPAEAGVHFDTYISDPAHPVPYRHRPISQTYPTDQAGGWRTWLVEVASWITAPTF